MRSIHFSRPYLRNGRACGTSCRPFVVRRRR